MLWNVGNDEAEVILPDFVCMWKSNAPSTLLRAGSFDYAQGEETTPSLSLSKGV
jgi:hypothetical protein